LHLTLKPIISKNAYLLLCQLQTNVTALDASSETAAHAASQMIMTFGVPAEAACVVCQPCMQKI